MPFDDRTFPSVEAASLRRSRHIVAAWLFGVAFMIWGMVVLGGATRLTGSGLSIMEWAPVAGALPPMSHAEWERLFALYTTIPQYSLLHAGMDLAGFQRIFWLEWTHRNWGRLMSVVYLGPLLWFSITGALRRGMIIRLSALFVLGGLQGAVGWFMVASGFAPDSTSVSPYRLVIHLALALCLFSGIFWTALSTLSPVPTSIAGGARLRQLAIATICLVALTLVAGGFTAGVHAGLGYNSFPLMGGRLFPTGYIYPGLSPILRNLTENPTAVQFDHRLLATLTGVAALLTAFYGLRESWRDRLSPPAQFALLCLGTAVLAQYALGVATLLSQVDISLAVSHQACAVALLASAIAVTHSLRGAR
jgi:cytochrome c oxidase assembly protein subunit 15